MARGFPTQPLVQRFETHPDLGRFDVCNPSTQDRSQLLDDRDQAATPSAPKQRPKLRLEALHRLRSDLELGLAMRHHAVAQELPFPRPSHGALLPVDLQSQPSGEEPFQRCHHPFPRRLRPHVCAAVVGITDKAMTPLLQFLVEFIQQDVQQERRQRAALRRSLDSCRDHAALHHPRPQIPATKASRGLEPPSHHAMPGAQMITAVEALTSTAVFRISIWNRFDSSLTSNRRSGGSLRSYQCRRCQSRSPWSTQGLRRTSR